ncbi:MAG: DUF501 domain-containing protein [bacterium]|nr:DUF501 domain-containing protein [bacterium]
MNHLFEEFDENDITVITSQLNTARVSLAGIIKRCIHGFPSVILLHPVRNPEVQEGEEELNYMAISTLIWLTCPFLNDRIHSLESKGYIDKITDLINDDRTFQSMMKDAHAHYGFLRKNIYRHFFGAVSSLDYNRIVFNTGIGGIQDIDTLKCLHLHYSHYMICKENCAGKITSKLLGGKIYCEKGNCKHALAKDATN